MIDLLRPQRASLIPPRPGTETQQCYPAIVTFQKFQQSGDFLFCKVSHRWLRLP